MKRALCIGINYPGTSSELRGCINDALLWKSFFSEKGYEVTLLLDEPEHGTPMPTRENILAEMKKLAESTQDNDYVVLTYSGHGSHVRDESGDEADRRDETICPCDYSSSGMIIDDEIKSTLLDPLPENAHFLGFMDCCHSGTSMDLQYNIANSARSAQTVTGTGTVPIPTNRIFYPYCGNYPQGVYTTKRNVDGTYDLGAYGHRIYPGYREYTPVTQREYRRNVIYNGPVRTGQTAGQKTVPKSVSNVEYRWVYFPFFGWYQLPYFINPVTEPTAEPTEPTAEPTEPTVEPTEPTVEPTEPVAEPTEPTVEPTEPVAEQPKYDIKCSDAVMFSGCSDKQTSADAYLDGKSIGAFTYCMNESLKNKTNSIDTHYRNVNSLLSSRRFEQRSNVSMSREGIKELNLF